MLAPGKLPGEHVHAITYVIASAYIFMIYLRLFGIFVRNILRVDDSEATLSHIFEPL
jgi:carbon starvation protein CstA